MKQIILNCVALLSLFSSPLVFAGELYSEQAQARIDDYNGGNDNLSRRKTRACQIAVQDAKSAAKSACFAAGERRCEFFKSRVISVDQEIYYGNVVCTVDVTYVGL